MLNRINADKSYTQVPRRVQIPEGVTFPADWLTKLGVLVTEDILKLDGKDKHEFLGNLDRIAGPASTYSLKNQLHESLQIIYYVLSNPATAADQKMALALKMREGVVNCSHGFHNRANELVIGLSAPLNLDDMLSGLRQSIVSKAASQTTNEVHAYNRFFVIAQGLGYGVRALSEGDIYQGGLKDETICDKISQTFQSDYSLFNVLTSVHDQINVLVKAQGYIGRQKTGYAFEEFQKFDDTFLKPYLTITTDELFDSEVDDNFVPKVYDINWSGLKKAILKTIRHEQYFNFTRDEAVLLDALVSDQVAFDSVPNSAVSLFADADELIRALTFFREWSAEKKAGLLLFYLKNKSFEDIRSVLGKLGKYPDLNKQILSVPAVWNKQMEVAAGEGDIKQVMKLVELGADINPVLGILLGKCKDRLMMSLKIDACLRAAVTREGLNTVVTSGAYQGKTVAKALMLEYRINESNIKSFFPNSGRAYVDLKEGRFPNQDKYAVFKCMQNILVGIATLDDLCACIKKHGRDALEAQANIKNISGPAVQYAWGEALRRTLKGRGLTPLQLAFLMGREDIFAVLAAAGADIDKEFFYQVTSMNPEPNKDSKRTGKIAFFLLQAGYRSGDLEELRAKGMKNAYLAAQFQRKNIKVVMDILTLDLKSRHQLVTEFYHNRCGTKIDDIDCKYVAQLDLDAVTSAISADPESYQGFLRELNLQLQTLKSDAVNKVGIFASYDREASQYMADIINNMMVKLLKLMSDPRKHDEMMVLLTNKYQNYMKEAEEKEYLQSMRTRINYSGYHLFGSDSLEPMERAAHVLSGIAKFVSESDSKHCYEAAVDFAAKKIKDYSALLKNVGLGVIAEFLFKSGRDISVYKFKVLLGMAAECIKGDSVERYALLQKTLAEIQPNLNYSINANKYMIVNHIPLKGY